MSELPDHDNDLALLIALAVLFILIGVLPFCAGWLNRWSLFMFPLGTFISALLIPASLIGLLFWHSRQSAE